HLPEKKKNRKMLFLPAGLFALALVLGSAYFVAGETNKPIVTQGISLQARPEPTPPKRRPPPTKVPPSPTRIRPTPTKVPTPTPTPPSPATGIYYGVYATSWLQDLSAVTTFEQDARKPVSIVMWYQGWGSPDTTPNFQPAWMDNVRVHGSIPMISWE